VSHNGKWEQTAKQKILCPVQYARSHHETPIYTKERKKEKEKERKEKEGKEEGKEERKQYEKRNYPKGIALALPKRQKRVSKDTTLLYLPKYRKEEKKHISKKTLSHQPAPKEEKEKEREISKKI
jgi:hypothetical protein